MANLTLRLVKGSPLTYAEVDNNFTALNDATGNFKNALINGNFDIWQRGTSFNLSGSTAVFSADRWFGTAGTSGVAVVTRQPFALGQTDVPGEPEFFLRHAQTTSASASHGVLHQRIESVRTFAGKTVTWTIWAKVGSGTKSLVPRLTQVFGSGSPTGDVNVNLSAITLTTSWQKFDMEFAVPSISGATIGSNNDDYLQVRLGEDSGFSTFTVEFAQSQLELGPIATSFERRPIGTELALCRRYFRRLDGNNFFRVVLIGFFDSLTPALVVNINFDSPMRISPTVNFDTASNSWVLRRSSTVISGNGSFISASAITSRGLNLNADTSASGFNISLNTGECAVLRIDSVSGFVNMSSEL